MAEASRNRTRAGRWILGGFCTIFIGVQFIRPELRNSPANEELKVPLEVKQILHNSCYSCHSNQTSLPWFDEVAPAYWLVTHDVKEGRKRLNFSEIGRLPVAQQKAVLFEAVNEIQLNAMPLPAYRLFHPESVITPQQLGMLKQYLRPPILNKATASTDRSVADGRINRGFRPTTPRQLYIRRQMESRLYLITRTKGRLVASRTVDNHPMRVIRQ